MTYTTDPRQYIARKYHDCTWCGDTIVPGMVYWRREEFRGTSVFAHKMHNECESASCGRIDYEVRVYRRGSRAKRRIV